ncbi:Uncharacterized conserved protein [Jonesia denitrificans]|nr:Uncharacterized conserved protein [Jonesia denitrificans]
MGPEPGVDDDDELRRATSGTGPYRRGMAGTYRLKRVYEAPDPNDGFRVLVDRLWPRGLSKSDAHIDMWPKDIAPSTQLRQWFHDEPQDFDEFAHRYRRELATNAAVHEVTAALRVYDTVTLLYAAKDTEHNHAVIVRDYLTSVDTP